MLGGFEKYLIHKAALSEKYIPFYLRWISGRLPPLTAAAAEKDVISPSIFPQPYYP
jgi:hypothetical protein